MLFVVCVLLGLALYTLSLMLRSRKGSLGPSKLSCSHFTVSMQKILWLYTVFIIDIIK